MKWRGWIVVIIAAISLQGITPCAASEVKLRKWYFGWQTASGQRSRYDVFGRDGIPADDVQDKGLGNGLQIGHRFGDRFLLGLQAVYANHEISNGEDRLADAEFLITGTVLFRSAQTLQPFLKGGFGGGSEILDRADVSGHVISYGTSAIAGGGIQVRLSSRFSLELEMQATFTNFMEVADDTENRSWHEDKWQVRTSNYGWRTGVGLWVWF